MAVTSAVKYSFSFTVISNGKKKQASVIQCSKKMSLSQGSRPPFDVSNRLTSALGNVRTNVADFLRIVFVSSPNGTDRQTDRRTGKTRNAA